MKIFEAGTLVKRHLVNKVKGVRRTSAPARARRVEIMMEAL